MRSRATDKKACWRDLKEKMAATGIHILEPKDLRPSERSWLQRLFMTHIFPILTPIAVDPAHPFPFILNQGLTLAVEMQRDSDGKVMNGLIPIPGQLERFIRLGTADSEQPELRFIRIETMIGLFIDDGTYRGVGVPIKLSRSRPRRPRPPVPKGADTEQVLRALGLTTLAAQEK